MSEKKYLIDNPALMAEWNWEKNNELNFNPTFLTLSTNKNVWWKCVKGHEWQATGHNRNRGTGCPYCSNKKVLQGYNDLATLNPPLVQEWNYTLNNDLRPEHVTPKSEKKVWWQCKKHHVWQAMVADRNNGKGCPYCSGLYAIKGETDLQTVNPILASEWDYENNNGLTPMDVLPHSEKRVWWICKNGHKWQARIASRTNGNGCPYCSGRIAVKGKNDLLTLNPYLAKEWNYSLNGDLTPEKVTAKSGQKVWWKCKDEHEWQAVISSRAIGRGCPVCMLGRQTSFPEYALLYYLREHGIEAIHSYKGQGYELDIYIPAQRVGIEYDGYYWHKNKTKKDLEKNSKCKKDGIKLYRIREGLPSLNDSSIDFLIQSNQKDLDQIIERILYNIIGKHVVINIQRDSIAIENLRVFLEKENSFALINPTIASEWNYEKNGKLKPTHFSANSGKSVWWKCTENHEWRATISNRNKGSDCPYCSGQKVLQGYNDLATRNPKLAQEWDCTLNGDLKPTTVSLNTCKKVWWKCKSGHTWKSSIANRNKGKGCPYCSGRNAIKGKNDLATLNPNLIQEWDSSLNGSLSPNDFLPNSEKNVWWECEHGHKWQAKIKDRTKGHGCPYCSNHKVWQGYNDLQTVNPRLALEWDDGLNGDLKPFDISMGSNKKVWWKCQNGHTWQSTVANRTTGHGCPFCSSHKAWHGYNDLQTVNPNLAKEWDCEKNNGLTPANVLPNSEKKVWWKCKDGHKWQATIASRHHGNGCPYCSGRKVIKGKNDLQTLNPKLADEWNYALNLNLTPQDVTANSGLKVWWKCKYGHEWRAPIYNRSNGRNCPY